MHNIKEENERIVQGGATAFPRMPIRPEYPPASRVLKSFILQALRGPSLAVIVARYIVYPIYLKALNFLVKTNKISERVFFGLATNVVHVLTYIVVNGMFHVWDTYGYMEQYKLARKPSQVPTQEMIKKTVQEFMLTQPIAFLVSLGLLSTFRKFGSPGLFDPLPSNFRMYLTFLFALEFNIFGFYFAHRLVHSSALYKLIHKQHHTFVGTVGVAAENANPIETVISAIIPTIGGCLLMKAHPVVWLTWLLWRSEETYEAHSGYCFADTFLDQLGLLHSNSSAYHDHHHTENKGNFGFEITDWLFGTMDAWVAQGCRDGYVKRARDEKNKIKNKT